ncbi:MAG TPA: adenylyl-sulfate kinase, partial [Humisphaera sp.]|nr:adenylyl-sulfate kinase [Humisphaera sp.]
ILNDAGLICICAFVAPHEAVREKARQAIGADRFLEVYLSAPADFCKQRDTTGAYGMAEAGQLTSFPGVSAAFEPPANPDLVLPTHEISANEAVGRVLELLRVRNAIG